MSRFARTPLLSNGSWGLWARPVFRRFLPEGYIVKQGEMLDYVAYRVYGKHEYWWAIAVANGILNPLRELRAGMRLRLPHPYEIERFVNGATV